MKLGRARRLALVAAAIAASPAAVLGQIYAVSFKDVKTAKRFAANCVEFEGAPALIGEAKSGITIANGKINYQGEKGTNELYVVNIADPSIVPYKVDGNSYVNAGVKGGVVTLTGNQIGGIKILLAQQSLYGLAREYALRKELLAELQKTRDAAKAGTPEWFAAHARFLGELERLHTWLATTIYPEAAKKLIAELDKQKKTVAKEARAQRLQGALASAELVPTPQKLVDLAKTLAPGAEFHVGESRHVRITYQTALSDEIAKQLLELAEKMIDGFRVEFVDPYVGADFADTIPEGRFIEFWFGPDEKNAHEHFLTDYYGVAWGDHKEERIAALSGRYRKTAAPEYLDYWKIADNKDFDAIVAHELGHVLANLHYNQGRKNDLPSWLEEGVGYWLALSYLGRNSVTCKEFAHEEYGNQAKGTALEHSVLMGEQELYTRMALERGPVADVLLRKPLHQMEDVDLAKSWSFFEYVAKDEGKKGQLWLRGICDVFEKSGPSLVQIRAKTEEVMGIQGDAFGVLDERWKKHAQKLQQSGAEPAKK